MIGPNGKKTINYDAKLADLEVSGPWLDDTLAYIAAHESEMRVYGDRGRLLAAMVAEAPAVGSILEFGVYRGASLGILVEYATGRRVVGFDSFQGLPEEWVDRYQIVPRGHFSTFGNAPAVPGAEMVIGMFEDKLQEWLASNPDPISLVHIDCDLYGATKFVLDQLAPRLGGVTVVFDEYWGYPDWRSGEWKALQDTGLPYRYLAHCGDYQAAVHILP